MSGWCCRSRPGFHPAPRSFWWRRRSMRPRLCSEAWVAWFVSCFPPPISKPEATTMRLRLWFCLALAMLASPLQAADRLNVVASFSILGDFVRNVGGERVNLTTLVGPDSDVHVYAPTPADAKKIADARLLIINGLGLEGWLPRLLQASGSKAPIITATNGIVPLRL